jgi:hypothetical protein
MKFCIFYISTILYCMISFNYYAFEFGLGQCEYLESRYCTWTLPILVYRARIQTLPSSMSGDQTTTNPLSTRVSIPLLKNPRNIALPTLAAHKWCGASFTFATVQCTVTHVKIYFYCFSFKYVYQANVCAHRDLALLITQGTCRNQFSTRNLD